MFEIYKKNIVKKKLLSLLFRLSQKNKKFLITIILLITIPEKNFALPTKISASAEDKSILKADRIEAKQNDNIIDAIGNVEIKNGNVIAYADKISYEKNKNLIKIYGNIKIKNFEIGNLLAKNAEISDDFESGIFDDGLIIFNDGSYLKSLKIERKNQFITKLKKPKLSICPNDEISSNNSLVGNIWDAISISSSSSKIDRKSNNIVGYNNILKIYEIPILYLPYIKIPLSENKRQSGFLHPSYVNNSQFGFGLNIPYFIDVDKNIDLVLTPRLYINSDQFSLNTEIKHLLKYGSYNFNLSLANNKITSERDKAVINRTSNNLRYNLVSDGKFSFTTKSFLEYKVNTVGDKYYLRDFAFNYSPYTISKIQYDYTNNKEYFGVRSLRIQELEINRDERSAPIILPSIDYFNESKHSIFLKEKYALSSNLTILSREDGLQYKRLSMIPEIKIPLNFYGNLIDINSKIQADLYYLENNYKPDRTYTNYKNNLSNQKNELSVRWRLPLIKKTKNTTLVMEPTANFVSSSVKKDFVNIPNEDSINNELTINNLFTTDRVSGYDRSEIGERVSYGLRSSWYNNLGKFELDIGQSYRISQENQDVKIRGFKDNNKSNIVGQSSYKTKNFDAQYLFQLNESNYINEVNNLILNLNFWRVKLTDSYLMIRKGIAQENKVEQNTISSTIDITKKLKIQGSLTRNLVSKTNLIRSGSIEYDGCCVNIKFIATENNSSIFTKTQRSFNINVTVKDL